SQPLPLFPRGQPPPLASPPAAAHAAPSIACVCVCAPHSHAVSLWPRRPRNACARNALFHCLSSMLSVVACLALSSMPCALSLLLPACEDERLHFRSRSEVLERSWRVPGVAPFRSARAVLPASVVVALELARPPPSPPRTLYVPSPCAAI